VLVALSVVALLETFALANLISTRMSEAVAMDNSTGSPKGKRGAETPEDSESHNEATTELIAVARKIDIVFFWVTLAAVLATVIAFIIIVI
jgi:hypothetical protein